MIRFFLFTQDLHAMVRVMCFVLRCWCTYLFFFQNHVHVYYNIFHYFFCRCCVCRHDSSTVGVSFFFYYYYCLGYTLCHGHCVSSPVMLLCCHNSLNNWCSEFVFVTDMFCMCVCRLHNYLFDFHFMLHFCLFDYTLVIFLLFV